MNSNDESLDLLDLEDEAGLDTLPTASPFAAPRPKKPWLLLGIGLVVIVLATYIIIRTVGSDSGSSVEIDLDSPEVVSVDVPETSDNIMVPPQVEKPAPTAPIVTPGVPVREINDRKEVKFDPSKTAAKKPATTKPAPTVAPVVRQPSSAPKAQKPAATSGWYVQFGSYSTRALAESAQKKLQAQHGSLLGGKQFVILAAVLPNGTTTYRLRIAFSTNADANGFCRNAKSDGLDCYVSR